MFAHRNPGRADEESRYLALLNALSELEHEFVKRGVPTEAQDLLGRLRELCRSDYRSRFG